LLRLPMKTRVITLSAISASLCTIVLTLGTYFADFFDLFAVVFGPILLCMPLYLDSPKGAFLAFLASGILALLISGFNITNLVYVSYFSFFGFYPIIKYVSVMKRWKKVPYYLVCTIWFMLALIGIYYYYTAFLGLDFGLIIKVKEYLIPILLAVASVPVYFLLDKFYFVAQISIFNLLKRVTKHKD